MKSNISENIKFFRKERNFTQEQLAEAMGVSVGAVSKWESGASAPELSLIMELSDFFGISVDALLGYKVRNNSAKETAERIKELQKSKKYGDAASEAEKSLRKFPNDFNIVYQSALVFFMKGLELCDDASLERALELYKISLNLYKEGDSTEACPAKIYREMAEAYDCLGKHREAAELLEKHNDNGRYSDIIGYIYSMNFRDDPKGIEYLSDSLVEYLSSLFRIGFGFANYYGNVYKDYQAALDALIMCKNTNDMFRIPGKRSYLDKSNVIILVGCAELSVCLGKTERAKKFLMEAKEIAEYFDEKPDYSARHIKFYHKDVPASSGDNFGETAVQGIENSIKHNTENGAVLNELWQKIKERSA